MLCSKNILMTTESIPCIKRIVPFFSKEYSLAFFLFIILFNFDYHDIVMHGPFPKIHSWEDPFLLQFTCEHLEYTSLLPFIHVLKNPRHAYKKYCKSCKVLVYENCFLGHPYFIIHKGSPPAQNTLPQQPVLND